MHCGQAYGAGFTSVVTGFLLSALPSRMRNQMGKGTLLGKHQQQCQADLCVDPAHPISV
jgi:hypothetical protein